MDIMELCLCKKIRYNLDLQLLWVSSMFCLRNEQSSLFSSSSSSQILSYITKRNLLVFSVFFMEISLGRFSLSTVYNLWFALSCGTVLPNFPALWRATFSLVSRKFPHCSSGPYRWSPWYPSFLAVTSS